MAVRQRRPDSSGWRRRDGPGRHWSTSSRSSARERVAIIGASTDPGSISARPAAYLRRLGFAGRRFVVHPRRSRCPGIQRRPSTARPDRPPDVALVLLSPHRGTWCAPANAWRSARTLPSSSPPASRASSGPSGAPSSRTSCRPSRLSDHRAQLQRRLAVLSQAALCFSSVLLDDDPSWRERLAGHPVRRDRQRFAARPCSDAASGCVIGSARATSSVSARSS